MSDHVLLRRALPADYPELSAVMFQAVHSDRSAYSPAQRQAWVPTLRAGPEWIQRLETQTIILAENSREVVGFMSLADRGYVDFAYIRPTHQGTGVFRKLFQAIEELATAAKQPRLWVHASLNARAAFNAVGFAVVQQETVEIGGQFLSRFEMEKRLP